MNHQRIKMLTSGAMLSALFGVLGIINLYTGSLFDIVFAYVMVVFLAYYTYKYDYQAGLMVVLAAFVVLFLVGEMFFTFFTSFTLILGVFYGWCLKRQKGLRFSKYGMIILSAIKNLVIFFVLGTLLGINVMQEGLEIYQGIIGMIPVLKNIISPEITFVLLWIIMFFCESYIIRVYSNLLIVKMMKRK